MEGLTAVKNADKNYVFLPTSNVIQYSILLTNNYSFTVSQVEVLDALDTNVKYVSGSTMINGSCSRGSDPTQGICIGYIEAGGNAIVTFEVAVDKDCPPNFLINKAKVIFRDTNNNLLSVETNELIIPVIDIDVCVRKSTEEKFVQVGKVVDYSVVVRNNSNIDIYDATFYDNLDSKLSLLPETVRINNIQKYIASFSSGYNLGIIKANSSLIITFKAIVNCLGNPPIIKNKAELVYKYAVVDNGIVVTSKGKAKSNEVMNKILPSDGCLN